MALPGCTDLDEGARMVQKAIKSNRWLSQYINQIVAQAIEDVKVELEADESVSKKSYNDFSSQSSGLIQDRSFHQSFVYRFRNHPDEDSKQVVRSNSSERDGDSEEKIRKSMFGQLEIIVPPLSARELLDEQPLSADLIDSQKKVRFSFNPSSSSQRHRSVHSNPSQKAADLVHNMNDRPEEEEKKGTEVVRQRDKNLHSIENR